MIRGRVLVIDADESERQTLGRALQAKGYVVDLCDEAMVGYRKAIAKIPDCIVCTPELPDINGAWVVRRVRTEGGAVAKIPILFVGDTSDPAVRAQTLNVGADVFLARPPAKADDVVAQVDALISMFRRLDEGPEEGAPSSTSMAAAVRGDLSAFPLASFLMMLEMERRSGTVHVVAQSGKRATLTLTDGLFATTELSGKPRPALEVLREALSWRAGRFSFLVSQGGLQPEARATVGALLLEAMRLEDEENAPAEELAAEDFLDDTI